MRAWIRAVVPDVQLPDAAFAARHRALRIVLTLLVPVLVAMAAFRDRIAQMIDGPHALHTHGVVIMWAMVVATGICAAVANLVDARRAGSLVVSLGLLLGSAALVHAGGGLTDLHFGFFIVLGLIGLYQEWLTLVLSVALVAVHHMVVGTLVPEMVFSDPRAWEHPVFFGLLHAVLVLAMCAVQLAYWRFISQANAETRRVEEDAAEQLRRREERYRALVQDSCDVINVVGRDGVIDSVSPAALAVMGYRPEDLVGSDYFQLIHPDDVGAIRACWDGGALEQRTEVRTRHADGSWHWHDVTLRDLTGQPAVAGFVVSHRDVTERREFQDLLQHEAAHDVLTGLLNRGALVRALEQALAALTDGDRLAVLFIDLNDFKPINDTHGHQAGDTVLVAVAHALQRSVLGSDTIGRLGGDEFAVVLHHIASLDNAIAVATRILAAMAEPVEVPGTTIRCRGSIGIAASDPGGGADTDELLHRADAAMYEAKRARDTGWAVYGEEILSGTP
ncbi:sensor domain-containing diguanylate cyclase [Actinoplanes couchii]|uniref:sensor domain-containing diguanylate cyclase n=1 Tax=Actinoplanes couchii TaxID=403638 RepID=UPI001944B567|nr:sensor domain-containing diguanylate cyclase [Actinoplanes couchii]MDR6318508.1 diguanylate cyclase (GGDEF)-like protein/PAS domain S-box-containing protein [Actinoplanes couchii]